MSKRSIIRKRTVCFFACAALLLVGVLLAWILWPRAAAQTRAQAYRDGLDTYRYDLVFRPEQSTMAVTLTLDYTNRTGDTLQELVLRTWAGAYASEDTSPAAIEEVYDACYPNGFSAGGVRLEGVWWNDRVVQASFADAAQTVLHVPVGSLVPGVSGRLLLRCELTVPRCAHRFGTDGAVWQFGNALPILSVWENGAWREDAYCAVGDPFVSDCSNYEVTLVAPAGYVCVASAKPSVKTMADGRMRYTMQGDAMRDFAFALSASWQTAQKSVNGVTVTAHAGDQKAAGRAAGYAAEALKTYARLYGAYAYDQLTVCEVDFPLGGMEYPGLIFIGRDWMAESQADSLELMLAHETAHQWFYALVGSDQVTDAWQDEALCEYAMLRYAREKYGANAYENLRILRVDAPMREKINQTVTPGSPISYFGSLQTYATVVYGRGAALPLALDEMTGGQMDKLLREYCDAFAFKRASRADFEQFFTDRSGLDITPLMRDYLDTYGY